MPAMNPWSLRRGLSRSRPAASNGIVPLMAVRNPCWPIGPPKGAGAVHDGCARGDNPAPQGASAGISPPRTADDDDRLRADCGRAVQLRSQSDAGGIAPVWARAALDRISLRRIADAESFFCARAGERHA